jgi:hypothetical protein
LVVIYCFSFWLLWKTFIQPSILNESFAGWSKTHRAELILIQCQEYLTPCPSCF